MTASPEQRLTIANQMILQQLDKPQSGRGWERFKAVVDYAMDWIPPVKIRVLGVTIPLPKMLLRYVVDKTIQELHDLWERRNGKRWITRKPQVLLAQATTK